MSARAARTTAAARWVRRGAACAAVLAACAAGAQPADTFKPVTDAMLQRPDPADWLMWRRTLDSWGFSPLTQIDKRNVSQLRLVWTRALGSGMQEGTPLVHAGVMYFPNPSDVIQAIDAASGDLLWEYRRSLPQDLGDYFPVPSINRNLAIYADTIIDTSADDFVFALDARNGQLRWETKILDYKHGAQQTSGPIIANGKIISGRGCEPEGSPAACIITAHDARTGRELWRRRTIAAPGETGGDSWGDLPDEARWHVGSWMVPSYDPELNLVYAGTSVTSPAPKFALAGNDRKYLYHNSTLALDADTGKIVWYYQHLVDHWDLDHPFERLLVETAIAPDKRAVTWINPKLRPGERRKVVTGIPGKTGVVYTLDARTGEFLWARPTVEQNVLLGIDGTTGEATVNPETTFVEMGQERTVCPTALGGKNWPAGTYSPGANVMFFPLQNTCMTVSPTLSRPSLDSLYGIKTEQRIAPNSTGVGSVYAISVETGATLWKYDQRAAVMSLVSTAGGLVFGGDAAGRFRALDAATGKVLWEINLGSPVSGYPVTFAVAGKQYVAVSTGSSLTGMGANRLTPELKPSLGNNLFVFALPN
ncbi:MAG TPA: PQQ-binding-like beta-propeller repeat protein [Gammaproteobacteria bacterium]|nr:PQQ-binding-like beta-propeller repeat protein [Gammaproteobacteria bacterium]